MLTLRIKYILDPRVLMIILISLVFQKIALYQIHVEKKSQDIVEIRGGQWKTVLQRDSAQGVVLYSFEFRNSAYSEIVDFKLLPLKSVEQVKEFADAFKAAEKTDPGDRVTVRDYFIVKSKAMGFTGYTLYYDNASCELSPKMVQRLTDGIDKYLKTFNHG